MSFDVPFTLGPFIVDHAGRLSPDAKAKPSFLINWRGRPVHITLSDLVDGLGRLTMHLTIGRVPSTALGKGVEARNAAFAKLRHLIALDTRAGSAIMLLADHRIVLEGFADLGLPMRAADMVTSLVMFLIETDPYLRLFEEAGFGLAAPLGSVGTANTWPG